MARTTVQNMILRLHQGEHVSFRQFMNTALYSKDGYYNFSVKIGGDGADFYTAALSPLFAFGITNAIISAWKRLSYPEVFQVVELGAGQGELALSITKRLRRLLPDVHFRYVIVEKSEMLAKIQQVKILGQTQYCTNENLTSTWAWGLPNPDVDSVIIGNEVLDAFPVERIRKSQGEWERSYIAYESQKNTYQEVWKPAPWWLKRIANHHISMPEGCIFETCLSYPSFAEQCSTFGRNIEFIFIDYGIYKEELFGGIRPEGTARGYKKHQVCAPWTDPGKVDITADVPWHLVENAMESAGFTNISLVKQGEFLLLNELHFVLEELRAKLRNDPIADLKLVGEFKQLCLPGGFGERFQVLTGCCYKG